jgi:hypothetical protein
MFIGIKVSTIIQTRDKFDVKHPAAMAKVSTTSVKLSRNFSEQKLTICLYLSIQRMQSCVCGIFSFFRPANVSCSHWKNQRFSVAPEAEESGLSGGDSGTRAVIPLPSVIV